ncbi:MAG TPA: hypothetical protein PLU30_02960 [Verrucomicrobiae bacterium]|nr:hypothetical protein [Verrucomicrobiae bacterium]
MKQRTTTGLVALGAMALLAPGCGPKKAPTPPHPLDQLYGFRDARFGVAPNQIPGLNVAKPIFKAAGIDYVTYDRSQENLRIRDVTLDEVRYSFFKKQLTEVDLLWEPRTRSDPSAPPPLFNVLTNQFGPPSVQDIDVQRLEFRATWETARVRLTLLEVRPKDGAMKKGRGLATIVSKGLAAQRDATTAISDGRQKPGF